MKKTIVILLAQLAISGLAIAADNVKATKKSTTNSEVNISNGTDIIGSKIRLRAPVCRVHRSGCSSHARNRRCLRCGACPCPARPA